MGNILSFLYYQIPISLKLLVLARVFLSLPNVGDPSDLTVQNYVNYSLQKSISFLPSRQPAEPPPICLIIVFIIIPPVYHSFVHFKPKDPRTSAPSDASLTISNTTHPVLSLTRF
jgi:hypothetical protein